MSASLKPEDDDTGISALYWRNELQPVVDASVPAAVARTETKPKDAMFWRSVSAKEQKTVAAVNVMERFPERRRYPKNVWIMNAYNIDSAYPIKYVDVDVCGMLQWRDDHPTYPRWPFMPEEWERTTIDPSLPMNAMLCQRLRDAGLYCPPFGFRMNFTTLMLYMTAYVLETCYKLTDDGKWVLTNPMGVPVIVRASYHKPLFGTTDSVNLFVCLLKLRPTTKIADEIKGISVALGALYDKSFEQHTRADIPNAPPMSFSHKCFQLAAAICYHSEMSGGTKDFEYGAFALTVRGTPPMDADAVFRVNIPPTLIEHMEPYRWTVNGIEFIQDHKLKQPGKRFADADDLYEILAWSTDKLAAQEAAGTFTRSQYMKVVGFYRFDWAMDLFNAALYTAIRHIPLLISDREARAAEKGLASRGQRVNRTTANALYNANPRWRQDFPDFRDQDDILILAKYDFIFHYHWIWKQQLRRSKVTKDQLERATAYFANREVPLTVDNVGSVISSMRGPCYQVPEAIGIVYISYLIRGGSIDASKKNEYGYSIVEEEYEDEEEEEEKE